MAKDNGQIDNKLKIRQKALSLMDEDPFVLETHAGYGAIYARLYSGFYGVAIEKNPSKIDHLVKQRVSWAIYEGDADKVAGVISTVHPEINFVDIDPYGSPFNTLDAFFSGQVYKPKKIVIAINDGQRQKVQMGGGWAIHQLEQSIVKFGNHNAYKRYLDICADVIERKASEAGYSLTRFSGFYGGHNYNMTNYFAVLSSNPS